MDYRKGLWAHTKWIYDWLGIRPLISPHKKTAYRKATLQWIKSEGKNVYGSVLNIGSWRDIYNYKQYFPNSTWWRNVDRYYYPHVDIVADVQNMSEIPSDVIDCVLCNELMHLVDDPYAVIREVQRVLKPNGVLLVQFPTGDLRKGADPEQPSGYRYWSYKMAVDFVEEHFGIEKTVMYIAKENPWQKFDKQTHLVTFIRARKKC